MNKLTKLLSVFVIAGAIGTGIIGVAGCKKGGGETHTHSYTYTNKGATHDGACECGKDPIIGQAHSWGTDGKCTANGCDAVKPAETNVTGVTITAPAKTTLYVGDKITLTATVQGKEGTTVSQDVTWAIVSGGSYATINAATGELTATGLGSVYVVATSVDGEVDSSPLTITVEERNLYAELVADTENNVIGEDFEDVSDLNLSANNRLPVYPGYTNTTPGLYEWGDRAEAADGCGVLVENGKAVHVTNKKNSSLIVDLTGEVKDVVEGYVELSVDNTGNDWAVLTLLGKFATSANYEEVFAIRMATGGVMGYRIGGNDTGTVTNSDSITFANDGTVYKIYYKLDMVSGLITVDITPAGGAKANLCTDVQTGIAELKGLMFVSSNSGGRLTTFDNIAVNSKTATLAEAQSSLKAKIANYNTQAVAHKGEGAWTASGTDAALTAAKTAGETAVDGAADITAAKAAYTSYETAVHTALAAEYYARLEAAYPVSNYNTSATPDDEATLTAYDKAMKAAETALKAVNNLADYETVYGAHDTICAALLTKEQENKPNVTIELYIKGGENTVVATINKDKNGATLKVDGVVTLDAIKTAYTATGKYVAKVYAEDQTTELTTDYTAVAAGGEATTVKFYVELGDMDNVSIDGALTSGMQFTPTGGTAVTINTDNKNPTGAASTTASKTDKWTAGSLAVSDVVTYKCEDAKSKIVGATEGVTGYKNGLNTGGKSKTNLQIFVITPAKACNLTVYFDGKVGKNVAISATNASYSESDTGMLKSIKIEAAKTLYSVSADLEAGKTYYVTCDDSTTFYEFALKYAIGGTTNPDTPDPTPGEGTAHTYTYSYANIDTTTVADMVVQPAGTTEEADKVTIKDKGAIAAGVLGGEGNGFLTVVSGVTYRDGLRDYSKTDETKKNPACIEVKDGGLTVTFQGTGTITISFSSTGSSNKSRLGVKKSGATAYLEATGTLPTGVTKIEAAETNGDNTGAYEMTGTSAVTLTFTVTEAGTYVIDCPSNVTTRGARITGIVMVDNFADAQA